ncbi:uncharacterized protein TNCV_2931811 [Trichonephila clavipes]|nr:uncharacterized protein TNCV_2931811 [Trichonephila clavipes]
MPYVCMAHNENVPLTIDVRAHLQATFPGGWIGRGGPIAWPARSPDLSPLDFFLWGFLKGLVYETPVATPEDLVGRIVEAAGCVRDIPGIFEKVRCSMQRRCQACLDASGKNFEHLLNYRGNFKGKLQEINIEPIEEVSEKISENTDSSDKLETSHTSNNSKRNRSVKRKGKHTAKTSKVQDKTIMINTTDCNLSILIPPNGNVKNSKKYTSIAQCKKKRMSLEENTNCGSIYNSNLSPEISNKSDENGASVVLNEIGQTFSGQKNINQTIEYNEQVSFNPNKKLWKNFTNLQKASKRDICSKEETTNKENEVESLLLSTSNLNYDKLKNNIYKTQEYTKSINSNSSALNDQLCPCTDILTAENTIQNKDVELVYKKRSDMGVINKDEKININSGNKCRKKNIETENNEFHGSKYKKVCFYFDEDTIETAAQSNKVATKKENNSTKRKRALKTITEMTNCNNEINQNDNSFVVTAEIHPIPDDVCEEKSNKKINISNLQPCVLLTDILKPNKAMSSGTVNKSLLENDCSKKAICVESETEMDAKENDPDVIFLSSKIEKKILPMESLLGKKLRCRSRALNYKEPALSTKMRRC